MNTRQGTRGLLLGGKRSMPPAIGLLLAAFMSLLMWAAIVGAVSLL